MTEKTPEWAKAEVERKWDWFPDKYKDAIARALTAAYERGRRDGDRALLAASDALRKEER